MTPPPTGIEALVCADISARQEMGKLKYGCEVATNPLSLLEWHRHHFYELLDAAIYTRKIIVELEKQNQPKEV